MSVREARVGTGIPARRLERSSVIGIRVARLLHQLQPLHYAEPVLLIYDHETQFRELDFLFDQGMRADNEMGVALCDVAPHLLFAVLLQRAREQHDSIAGIFKDLPRG